MVGENQDYSKCGESEAEITSLGVYWSDANGGEFNVCGYS